ncbi:MAG: Fic family protein [Patescibacteria group bacterium]|nr:Fic family protein [Patescibacteria group bacterium]
MPKLGAYIKQPAGFRAFVPADFPPKELIHWDQDLLFLLSEADIAIGGLKDITRLVPDVDFFIFMYVNKEAALSSQIEGTQATLIDYMKAEADMNDNAPSDVDEIRNYIKATNFGLSRLNELPLSLRLIKDIHEKLLRGVRGKFRSPGEFRSTQNWIGGPSIETANFVPPSVPEMKRALGDVEKFIHDKERLPVLVKAGLLHAQFETIHPFLDGNGRTGRLLITLYLCHAGVLQKPLLYLSAYFKRHRTNYYDKLNGYRFSENGPEEWLKFFLEGVKTVANEAVETAKKITDLREKHLKTAYSFGKISPNAVVLLDYLYANPIVDAKRVATATGLASKASVNALIGKFVKAGIVTEITGRKRDRKYLYRDYARLFD